MTAPLRSYEDAVEPEPETEECASCETDHPTERMHDLCGKRVCRGCWAAARAGERIGSDLALALEIVNGG